MNLPGRMETQRALIADYKNHAARFDAIAKYDGGHFLLETHAAAAVSLMLDFIRRTQCDGRDS
jgi:hypothetical protein